MNSTEKLKDLVRIEKEVLKDSETVRRIGGLINKYLQLRRMEMEPYR